MRTSLGDPRRKQAQRGGKRRTGSEEAPVRQLLAQGLCDGQGQGRGPQAGDTHTGQSPEVQPSLRKGPRKEAGPMA